MSRAISSYPSWERQKVAKRRLAMPEAMRGMGYWAAVDAKVRMEEQKELTSPPDWDFDSADLDSPQG